MRTSATNSALAFHHVGYVTKAIEPAVTAYVARFGYEPATPIIHDPLQTAFVQFLKLAGDSGYLEFVAPDSAESVLARAAQRGGLNHLCFTAGLLEDVIADLEQQEMRLIAEPKPATAFAGRRICWMIGNDLLPIEFVERKDDQDACIPGTSESAV